MFLVINDFNRLESAEIDIIVTQIIDRLKFEIDVFKIPKQTNKLLTRKLKRTRAVYYHQSSNYSFTSFQPFLQNSKGIIILLYKLSSCAAIFEMKISE